MRVLPVNRSAVLIELASLDDVVALHASLVSAPVDGILEILPAAQTLMLRFDPAHWTRQMLIEALSQRDLAATSRTRGALVEIPMRYDGEDLAEVARLCGLSLEEVIRRHGAREYTVAFCGFSPGFGYLIGGDPMLQVPRRSTPRTRVPAGSVAIAGGYCGVYPQASPGGWQIIGTTSMRMWDSARAAPAILSPGTRVKFIDIGASALSNYASVPFDRTGDPSAKEKDVGRPYLEVIASALPALVQDLGRPGHTAIGVTASGALDRESFKRANAVAGNPPDLAALEIAFGHFAFKCSDDTVIAFGGAPAQITITRASGEIVDAAMNEAISLKSGDRVKLGYPALGVRTYLAVRGGLAVSKTLGSASRDVLAGLGPEPIVKGAILAVGRESSTEVHRKIDEISVPVLPASGDEVVLDIFEGPRADWFTEDAFQRLCNQPWRVTPQSNRVGLRLQGEKTLTRRFERELPSEGMVSGAIQVPHDGQLVLLLGDHPVTGGYPVIAVVAEHHLDLAGQIPPGATIRFRVLPRSEPRALSSGYTALA
jgi:KipI family sensor histidine kinase inhibitor